MIRAPPWSATHRHAERLFVDGRTDHQGPSCLPRPVPPCQSSARSQVPSASPTDHPIPIRITRSQAGRFPEQEQEVIILSSSPIAPRTEKQKSPQPEKRRARTMVIESEDEIEGVEKESTDRRAKRIRFKSTNAHDMQQNMSTLLKGKGKGKGKGKAKGKATVTAKARKTRSNIQRTSSPSLDEEENCRSPLPSRHPQPKPCAAFRGPAAVAGGSSSHIASDALPVDNALPVRNAHLSPVSETFDASSVNLCSPGPVESNPGDPEAADMARLASMFYPSSSHIDFNDPEVLRQVQAAGLALLPAAPHLHPSYGLPSRSLNSGYTQAHSGADDVSPYVNYQSALQDPFNRRRAFDNTRSRDTHGSPSRSSKQWQ